MLLNVAPSTLDATRVAKQIRMCKSHCNNSPLHTARQATGDTTSRTQMGPGSIYLRCFWRSVQCGWRLRKHSCKVFLFINLRLAFVYVQTLPYVEEIGAPSPVGLLLEWLIWLEDWKERLTLKSNIIFLQVCLPENPEPPKGSVFELFVLLKNMIMKKNLLSRHAHHCFLRHKKSVFGDVLSRTMEHWQRLQLSTSHHIVMELTPEKNYSSPRFIVHRTAQTPSCPTASQNTEPSLAILFV